MVSAQYTWVQGGIRLHFARPPVSPFFANAIEVWMERQPLKEPRWLPGCLSATEETRRTGIHICKVPLAFLHRDSVLHFQARLPASVMRLSRNSLAATLTSQWHFDKLGPSPASLSGRTLQHTQRRHCILVDTIAPRREIEIFLLRVCKEVIQEQAYNVYAVVFKPSYRSSHIESFMYRVIKELGVLSWMSGQRKR